jgi:hypothetical protein
VGTSAAQKLVRERYGATVWGNPKTREQVEQQPALRRLCELLVELILVPHGAPITTNARQALQQALEADTWQRPQLA